MARLKKLRVTFISLVSKPATKLQVVYKSEDAEYNEEKQIAITKSTAEGLVYGTVYQPNVKDADGDWACRETIKKAAHDFLRGGGNANVDIQHDEKPSGAHVVESYLDEKGAWQVAIQMDPQSAEFKKVQKGELKGLSMGAFCEKAEEEPPAEQDGESESGRDGEITKGIAELKEQITKMAGEIDRLNQKVDKVPKSKQIVIEGNEVHHVEKNEGGKGKFREFVFSDLV